MRKDGFTLVELVMVIVILGILSIVVIPKYVDLQGKAREATANSILASAASACSINYVAVKTKAVSTKIDNCTSMASNLNSEISIVADQANNKQCSFSIDGKNFIFTIVTADDTPCTVSKLANSWPAADTTASN